VEGRTGKGSERWLAYLSWSERNEEEVWRIEEYIWRVE